LTAAHRASLGRPPFNRGDAGVARAPNGHAVSLSRAHPTSILRMVQMAEFGLPMRNSLDFGHTMRYHIDRCCSREMSRQRRCPGGAGTPPERGPQPKQGGTVDSRSLPRPVDTRSRKPGDACPSLERLAERAEEEISRLKELRPALSSRIDRAASILVMHLSSPRRSRTMRVRVGAVGPRFLVASGSASSAGAVYVVDPRTWACSCPDYHRRNGGACKHTIACYVLWRCASGEERG
jgi:hypothetical protein